MIDILPKWPLLMAFLGASVILAVTPGPGVVYIVTRSLTRGRLSGLASVAGVALGNLGNAVAAALGLAAWFAVSSLAFSIFKYAGAAYLVYLAFRTLLCPGEQAWEAVQPRTAGLRQTFLDAFTVALLNPKTTLFFAAFLPQFMGQQSARTSILLGFIFVTIAAITDTVYALAAGLAAARLLKGLEGQAAGRKLRAGLFLGLGLYTALAGVHRTAR